MREWKNNAAKEERKTAMTDWTARRRTIEDAFEKREQLAPDNAPEETRRAVEDALDGLDSGELRVAEPGDGGWQTHEWLKKGGVAVVSPQ